MMKVLYSHGDDDLARVFVAELDDGSQIEFVESVQPPIPRRDKWVLIVSTLKGCPVACPICDAGGGYRGKLSTEEILSQIEYMVTRRYPNGRVPVPKLKIQFARMGDPAFNTEVLGALEELPNRFDMPGLIPSISTIAPRGCESFFQELLAIKQKRFSGGRFQMQFSVHSTDEKARRRLIPIQTWSLKEMAAWGNRFFEPNDRKITLNFAAARGMPLSAKKLKSVFSNKRFLVKLTPINPTRAALKSGLKSLIDPTDEAACEKVVRSFEAMGFETILSIGELEENQIGSNCGMYVSRSALDAA
jgi:23S rRNA (adenine2503-C2)-methyltransferase